MTWRIIVLGILMVFVMLGQTEGGWDRTVEEWTKWSHPARMYYLMGVLDGWVNIQAAVSRTEDMEQRGRIVSRLYADFVTCQKIKGFTYEKVYSLVEADLIVHPGQEKYALASVIWTALARGCDYKFLE